MARKVQKTVSFTTDLVEQIEKYPVSVYDNNYFSYKVNEMAKLLNSLRKYGKRELLSTFSREEACVIYGSCYNLMYAGELSPKKVLMLAVEEALSLGEVDLHNWKADENTLKKKLQNLTEFQAYTVLSNVFEVHKILSARRDDSLFSAEDLILRVFNGI